MYKSHYAGDPRWITAKFDSHCGGCQTATAKGDRVFYYPKAKTVYAIQCGCAEKNSRDFESCRADEDVFNGFGTAY